MPKSKKSDTESSEYDSDSGPDDREVPPPTKKSKAADKSKSEPAESEAKKSKTEPAKKENASSAKGPWILEGLRQVRINEFRGRKMVDIREYYSKGGETLPGKKGISLSVTQWLKLLENVDEITAAVQNQ